MTENKQKNNKIKIIAALLTIPVAAVLGYIVGIFPTSELRPFKLVWLLIVSYGVAMALQLFVMGMTLAIRQRNFVPLWLCLIAAAFIAFSIYILS